MLGLRRRRADRYADKNPDEVLSKGWTLCVSLLSLKHYGAERLEIETGNFVKRADEQFCSQNMRA